MTAPQLMTLDEFMIAFGIRDRHHASYVLDEKGKMPGFWTLYLEIWKAVNAEYYFFESNGRRIPFRRDGDYSRLTRNGQLA